MSWLDPFDPRALDTYLRDVFLARQRTLFLDETHGGFHERADADGRPLPLAHKRLLVQCRQIFGYALGARLWPGVGFEACIAHGLQFLESYRDPEHGGWYFQVTVAGEPLDPRKDLYAHGFMLLALTETARVAPSARVARWLDETLTVLDERFATAGRAGYHEQMDAYWKPLAGPRLQNPHMHLLEGMLAVSEATGHPVAAQRARALVELCTRCFVDRATGTLGEVFDPYWRPHPEQGARVEPGHHFEWAWLLERARRLVGAPYDAGLAAALAEWGYRHGLDAEHGGIYDAVDRTGAVLMDTKRIWPLTEGIKAAACAWQRPTGLDATWRTRLGVLLDHLLRHYLRPDGTWCEHLDRRHQPLMRELPGTTGYHVLLALTELSGKLSGRTP